MQYYMLDTTVFNDVLDQKIDLSPYPSGHLLVTAVQEHELRDTKDPDRRSKLLGVFKDIAPAILTASSACFDIAGAGFDEAHWNDGSGRFEAMLSRLQALTNRRKSRLPNQIKDIVIAETAIKNNAVLISQDGNLRIVVIEHGGEAIPAELKPRDKD